MYCFDLKENQILTISLLVTFTIQFGFHSFSNGKFIADLFGRAGDFELIVDFGLNCNDVCG